ncbi:MAG TPA: YCF48-related protein [Candidatus Angelobacter sp.]
MKLIFSLALLCSLPASGQWEKIDVPTQASLRGLSVVSKDVVWASGTEGTVIRSVDSGKHWSVITVPGAEKLDFRGIRAFDGNTAVIISSGPAEKGQARIYRTTDSGKTWKQVFEEKRAGIFFDAVAFWDRKHGIVLSDPVEGRFVLFTTDDGGVTWRQVAPSVLPPALPNEGAFAASNSCLVVHGDRNVWFATGGAQAARVFRSTNRGRTWAVTDTPMHPANASSGIFSLAFEDVSFGVAVGGDYKNPGNSELPNLLITSNGGKTWRIGKPKNHPGFYLSSVIILPHPLRSFRPVIAAGTTGLFFASLIDDQSWTRQSQENLNAVADISSGTWAVGPKGTVLHLGPGIVIDF